MLISTLLCFILSNVKQLQSMVDIYLSYTELPLNRVLILEIYISEEEIVDIQTKYQFIMSYFKWT